MTEAVQTVVVVTGDADDHAAMLAEVGPLTVEAIYALVGREDDGVVEPSFDDDGRWVFPGSVRAALALVKALSVKYPTLEWFVHLPSEDNTVTYDYSLIAGEGVEEKRTPYTSVHSHLPVGEFVIYRARVGKSSHVLSAVYVIADGQAIDVTCTHLPRSGGAASVVGDAGFDHYDEDGIDMMLAQAH